jgi:mannose/fructose/N-acetylgalactosamine-specific phosphotransferase system component IIC
MWIALWVLLAVLALLVLLASALVLWLQYAGEERANKVLDRLPLWLTVGLVVVAGLF